MSGTSKRRLEVRAVSAKPGQESLFCKVKASLTYGLAMVSVASMCWQIQAQAVEGSAGCVVLDAKSSAFWRTAVVSPLAIPIEYPQGATAATLAVTGMLHKAVYAVQEGDFSLHLPMPALPENEDVYELTLSFDDGSIRKATVACVAGVSHGGTASNVLVRLEKDSRKWQRVRDCHAVLPIPCGMRSLVIDGETVDADLDGAAGWYALGPMEKSRLYELSMTDSGQNEFDATLYGASVFFRLIFR